MTNKETMIAHLEKYKDRLKDMENYTEFILDKIKRYEEAKRR